MRVGAVDLELVAGIQMEVLVAAALAMVLERLERLERLTLAVAAVAVRVLELPEQEGQVEQELLLFDIQMFMLWQPLQLDLQL
jgi:hypothetical protein